MSKLTKQVAKVEAAEADAARIENIKAEAAKVQAPVSNLIKYGLLDEAEAMIANLKAKAEAEAAVEAAAAGIVNRFEHFRRRYANQLKKSGRVSMVEDSVFWNAISNLEHRAGKSGETAKWAIRGASKALAAFDYLNSLGVNWELYFADYRRVCKNQKPKMDWMPASK